MVSVNLSFRADIGKNVKIFTTNGSVLVGKIEDITGDPNQDNAESGRAPCILLQAEWCGGVMTAVRTAYITSYIVNEGE